MRTGIGYASYIRRAPQRKVKNSWSPAQVRRRQRFSLVSKFCKLFKNSLISRIWNYEEEKMTGYSLFLKANMPAFALDGSLEDAKKIQLSTGKLRFLPCHHSKKVSFISKTFNRKVHKAGAKDTKLKCCNCHFCDLRVISSRSLW